MADAADKFVKQANSKKKAAHNGQFSSVQLAEQHRKNAAKKTRRMVTPEGVDLRLNLSDAGERAGAFMIDLMIQLGLLVALSLGVFFSVSPFSQDIAGEFVTIIWLLGAFALRNFYFIAFETGPRAATPGKRIMGLRVVNRTGGRLRAENVFARNAMREIEVFLPLSFTAPGVGVDGWITTAGLIWSLIFLLFPLFNKDKLRAGDMIAGTWVVKAPKLKLNIDLAGQGETQLARGLSFSRDDLEAYGVHELHVLETVLRNDVRETRKEVAEQIRKKLNRKKTKGFTDRDFLVAYYAALRQHLEGRMVMGVRRKDKHDKVR